MSYHHRCPQGQGGNQGRSPAHSGRSPGNFHSAETRTGQVPVHDIRQCLRTEAGERVKREKQRGEGKRGRGGRRGRKSGEAGRSAVEPLTKAGGEIWASPVSRRTDAFEGAVSVGADAALTKVLLAALVHVCRTGHPTPRATIPPSRASKLQSLRGRPHPICFSRKPRLRSEDLSNHHYPAVRLQPFLTHPTSPWLPPPGLWKVHPSEPCRFPQTGQKFSPLSALFLLSLVFLL